MTRLRSTRMGFALTLVAGLIGSAPVSAAELKCSGEKVTISWRDPGVGTTILGTSGRDVIQGSPMDEKIRAGRGEDLVCGGGGDDFIERRSWPRRAARPGR